MKWPRVNPGDRLKIPADLHNATIEAVEAYIRNKTTTGGRATAERPRQATIYVRNNSGADIAQGGVLGLSEPVWPGYRTYPKPTAQGQVQFLGAEILFLGVLPVEADHAGKFAVAIEPIPSGAVGRAVVQGVMRVKVKIEDLSVADWADVTDGEVNYLTAAAVGSARILWYEGDAAGTVWAVCMLGAGGAGSPDEAESANYAFVAHYAAEAGAATSAAFWTKSDLLNSFINIGLDVRYCTNTTGDEAGNKHPAFQEPLLSGAPLVGAGWGNAISTRSGKDDSWIDLAYSAVDVDGNDLGHGITAITGFKIQAQIATDGTLSLRVDNQTGVYGIYVDITGVLWKVKVPIITVGTQIEFGLNTCHESPLAPNTWGDGHWNPSPIP